MWLLQHTSLFKYSYLHVNMTSYHFFNVHTCTTLLIHFAYYDQRLRLVPQIYDYANFLLEKFSYQLITSVLTLLGFSVMD